MAQTHLLYHLVAKLLLAIHGLSPYPVPETQPEVVLVAHRTLEQMACHRPCQVYGWFPGGTVIYLDDRLDPVTDVSAAGILVHELVHFLQQENGRFRHPRGCAEWLQREQEAYRIQNRWLRQQRSSAAPPVAPVLPPWRLTCDDGADGNK